MYRAPTPLWICCSAVAGLAALPWAGSRKRLGASRLLAGRAASLAQGSWGGAAAPQGLMAPWEVKATMAGRPPAAQAFHRVEARVACWGAAATAEGTAPRGPQSKECSHASPSLSTPQGQAPSYRSPSSRAPASEHPAGPRRTSSSPSASSYTSSDWRTSPQTCHTTGTPRDRRAPHWGRTGRPPQSMQASRRMLH